MGYITGSVSFISDGFGQFIDQTEVGGLTGCRTVNVGDGWACVDSGSIGAGTTPGGTAYDFLRLVIEVALVAGFALTLVAEVRRQLKAK